MTTKRRTIPIEDMIALYREHKNVHKVGAILGIRGTSVHERLTKHGVIESNGFTKEDDERIQREYEIFRGAGKLAELAESMGRPKTSICRRARMFGLTDKNTPRPWIATWKYLSEEAAETIWDEFKASKKNLGQFCHDKGWDDLGFSTAMKRYFGDEWEHVIEAKANKQTKYRLGRQFEYRIRDDMKKHGYFVLRSPQSKSPVDLIAIKTGRVVFIQCKRGGSIDVAEWNKFYDLCLSVGAEPVLASMTGYRGHQYQVMTDRKDGSKRRQPLDDGWTP